MIAYDEAYRLVLNTAKDFGAEIVPLNEASGRVLAEDVFADRDFPPFDRATKDGIALKYAAIETGYQHFTIEGVAAAGAPRQTLSQEHGCIEIMTGAVVPNHADTVIMYEHLTIENGTATLQKAVKQGQNIHQKGSDEPKGSIVLKKNNRIGAAEIGVLASVGKGKVKVKKHPKIAIVSTGDELVDVDKIPEEHQIRKSNSHTLQSALSVQSVDSKILHINDIENELQSTLRTCVKAFDVLLLSGGVSMGKYDFLPQVFEDLGIKKHFHKVAQRPGKPFWFGQHAEENCTIFAFPGNPASTFANYQVYFLPWLLKSLQTEIPENRVIMDETFENNLPLTRFLRAKVFLNAGVLKATLVLGNGSGDLTSLTEANGFIRIEPNKIVSIGDVLPFYPTKTIL